MSQAFFLKILAVDSIFCSLHSFDTETKYDFARVSKIDKILNYRCRSVHPYAMVVQYNKWPSCIFYCVDLYLL